MTALRCSVCKGTPAKTYIVGHALPHEAALCAGCAKWMGARGMTPELVEQPDDKALDRFVASLREAK